MEYLKILDKEVLHKTKLFEISRQLVEYSKKSEKGNYYIEVISRPPGVRLLIIDNNKILLTKEFRFEINDWDYRLPGGRVFDTINPYLEIKENEIELNKAIEKAVLREAEEEAGILPLNFELINIDRLGASLFWDLYFYKISSFEVVGQTTIKEGNDVGEIIYPEWFTFAEVKGLCLNDKISETRASGFLLKYILKNEK